MFFDVIQAFQRKLDELKKTIKGIRLISYKDAKFLVTLKMVQNPMMGKTQDIIHSICNDGYKTENGLKIKTKYPSQQLI